MCEGKSKSSVIQMHMCDSTQNDLQLASGKVGEVVSNMTTQIPRAEALAEGMQSAAAEFQQHLGPAGDSAASDLMQSAKSSAGKIEESAGDADTTSAKLT